jgi:hypothetical protein
LTHTGKLGGFNAEACGYANPMNSGRSDRNEQLEEIVDELDENVMGEREAEDVPGKPSERDQEPKAGSADEPTA